jgi:hypothetical protein
MPDTFWVGDTVQYEDAYTGELKYGRITRTHGNNFIITTITEKEAVKNPKQLPKPRIARSFAEDVDGNPICSYHRIGLQPLAVHGDQPNPLGLGHLSAWICPETGKQVYDAGCSPGSINSLLRSISI